jgi:hypothetical protein
MLWLLSTLAPAAAVTCPNASPQLQALLADPQFANVYLGVIARMYVDPADPAKANVPQLMTAATSTYQLRRTIYDALRHEAETVQTRIPAGCGGCNPCISIRDHLGQGELAGVVDAGSAYHLWVDDAVVFKGKPAFIGELCNRSDVLNLRIAPLVAAVDSTPPDATEPWSIPLVGTAGAWAAGFRGRGGIVGVIDTGANVDHQDLSPLCKEGSQNGQSCRGSGKKAACVSGGGFCVGALVRDDTGEPYWKDTTLAAPFASPDDDHGHGTFMVGVAAGRNDVGVAPDANWIACRARIRDPLTGQPRIEQNLGQLAKCAQYLMNPDEEEWPAEPTGAHPMNAADVIVFPGILDPEPTNDVDACNQLDGFRVMVSNLRAYGILPVFPVGDAGNVGVPSPANYRAALAVGMTADTSSAPSTAIDPSSNHGTILCMDGPAVSERPAPWILAPGLGVRGPWKKVTGLLTNNYETLTGSDVAAAHVAGGAAVLVAANPDLEMSVGHRPAWFPASETRRFVLDELLGSTASDHQEDPFVAGRLNLANAIGLHADFGGKITNFPHPFYTSESGSNPNIHNTSVTMNNTSAFTWTSTTPVSGVVGQKGPMKLASIPAGSTIWGSSTINMPVAKVLPGEQVTFSIPARAPLTLPSGNGQSGSVPFYWWMSHPSQYFGEASELESVTIDGRDLAVSGSVSPPLHDVAGSLASYPCATVTATMTNAPPGTTTWTKVNTPGSATYKGRYRLFDLDGSIRTTAEVDLVADVAPGATVTFPGVSLCAPDASGSYPFTFQVLRNGAPIAGSLQSQVVVRNEATIAAASGGALPLPDQTSCEGFHTPFKIRITNSGNRRWDTGTCLREVQNGFWNIHPPVEGQPDPEPFCTTGPVAVGAGVNVPEGFVAYRHCVWPYTAPTGPSRMPFDLAVRTASGAEIGHSVQWLASMERFVLAANSSINPFNQFSYRYWNGSGWALMTFNASQSRWEGGGGFIGGGTVRPGGNTPVAIFFKAPHTGPLTITDSISDVDNCGANPDGDGVNLLITHHNGAGALRATVRSEALIPKGANNGPGALSYTVNADMHDTLRVIFKPNGNNNCDATLSLPSVLAGVASTASYGPNYATSGVAVEPTWD